MVSGAGPNHRCGRNEEAAAQARGSFFKVTGCASPDISSPTVCRAHRGWENRYATLVAGLRSQRVLAASEGCFLEEVGMGPGFGG